MSDDALKNEMGEGCIWARRKKRRIDGVLEETHVVIFAVEGDTLLDYIVGGIVLVLGHGEREKIAKITLNKFSPYNTSKAVDF